MKKQKENRIIRICLTGRSESEYSKKLVESFEMVEICLRLFLPAAHQISRKSTSFANLYRFKYIYFTSEAKLYNEKCYTMKKQVSNFKELISCSLGGILRRNATISVFVR